MRGKSCVVFRIFEVFEESSENRSLVSERLL